MSFSCPANQCIALVHDVTFVGTSIAYELEQTFFKVSTGVVMKTPVKIIKREDRKVTHDVAISSSNTKRQRTTEVIVKSWIVESRERRRANLNIFRAKEI